MKMIFNITFSVRYLADFVFSHFDMGPGAAKPNPPVCASLCRFETVIEKLFVKLFHVQFF